MSRETSGSFRTLAYLSRLVSCLFEGAEQVVRPRRLGLLLTGIDRTNVPALKFLLLQTNHLQRTFEVEFLPEPPNDDFLNRLQSKNTLDRDQTRQLSPAFAERCRLHLEGLISDNKLREPPPDYFIVISLARFADEYYSTRTDNVSVIALGNWKRYMAPPTIVEFLLTLVIREAIAALSPSLRGSSHLGTKGCVCDFTYNLDDVKFKVLTGLVCSYCRAALSLDKLPNLAKDVETILSKRWLGDISNPTTPAAIASKLGHNLFTTKGLQPTRWERFTDSLQDEGAKTLMQGAGVALLAILSALAGAFGWEWIRMVIK